VTAFLNAVVSGIEAGSLYSLVALGLNIVYATTRVFNFAHGTLVMAGALGGVILWQSFHVPVFLAFICTVAWIAVVGGFTERIAVRSSLRRGNDASGWLLSTLGISIIIQSAFSIVVDRQPGSTGTRQFPSFLPVHKVGHLNGVLFQPNQIFVVLVMLAITGALVVFQRRTHYGRALGAVADDRVGAAARGLPVNRLGMLSFCIGAAIAATTGFAAAPVTQASVSVGLSLTVSGFIAATIGGIPTIEGAVVGGLLLGLVQQFTAQYTSGQALDLVTLGALLLVLTVRPQGIFGRRVRSV
jgi:branched-subunit amino acid ABC-type transport system permease component